MATFESTKVFPIVADDLTPVANDVMQHFRANGFEVKGEESITKGWRISVTKGSDFKAVLGMKTALNIEIEPMSDTTSVKAGIGIFGQQAIPGFIAMFIAWPVMLPMIWGMVQQAKLDDEAITMIERSLIAHGRRTAATVEASASPSAAETKFCTSCGAKLEAAAKFCPNCGAKVAAGAEPVLQ